jgi:hypothetical protein
VKQEYVNIFGKIFGISPPPQTGVGKIKRPFKNIYYIQ